VAESKKKIKEQHPLEIKKEIDGGVNLTLVDVREGDEYKKSRIGLSNVVHLSRVCVFLHHPFSCTHTVDPFVKFLWLLK